MIEREILDVLASFGIFFGLALTILIGFKMWIEKGEKQK